MFSKNLIAMALVLTASIANAGSGMSKLRFSEDIWGGYDLTMEGDTITGWIDGVDTMKGKVELVKKDGRWTGHLGLFQIHGNAPLQTAANKSNVQIGTLPGGHHSFSYKMKPGEIRLNGILDLGRMVGATMDLKKLNLNIWNDRTTLDIRDRARDGIYKGQFVYPSLRTGFFETVDSQLTTTGDLNPAVMAKEDQALFAILYVIPLNYFH